jgi:MFS family permease
MVVRVVVSIVALFLSLVLLVLGNGLLGTLLAVRLELEGFEPATSGLVLAMFSVGYVVGSLYGIRVVERVGHIRAFAAFGAIAVMAILLHPLYISMASWMALRLVVGLCIAGLTLVKESWVNTRATPQTRGTLLAVYMVLFFLAAASGQFLLALGDPGLYHLFSLAAMLVSLSLIPLLLTRSPAPTLHEHGVEQLGVRTLLRLQALGLFAAFLGGVVTSAFSAVGPMFAARAGLDLTQISLFMGIATLAAMVFQGPVGLLSDYLPRGLVIVGIATAALAASLAAALFGTASPAALFVTVALFVGTSSSLYALSLALTHDALHHTQIVPASATLLLAFGVGTVVGPVGGATTMGLLGPAGLFFFTSGALAVLVLLSVGMLWRQPAPPVQEQTHCYSVAPVATPVLMEIDPRNETFEPLTEEFGEDPVPAQGKALADRALRQSE